MIPAATSQNRPQLQACYDNATALLRQGLLDGQSWESLEPVRRQVTELEIALDLNHAPKRTLRIRRGR
ncbi:hypothetical protein GCM10023184_26450 [Flaviaesturariibacter amylovorans]|uniref:Uncharacterized protein n=2 Tax=Flaviaesturariibacter amylovorans TaxID=1084520 RepID=A0ABP8H294_9BACT